MTEASGDRDRGGWRGEREWGGGRREGEAGGGEREKKGREAIKKNRTNIQDRKAESGDKRRWNITIDSNTEEGWDFHMTDILFDLQIRLPDNSIDNETIDKDRGIKDVICSILATLGSPPRLHRYYVHYRTSNLIEWEGERERESGWTRERERESERDLDRERERERESVRECEREKESVWER